MIFDKLCGIVERHLPQLRDRVERAVLVEVPEIWEEIYARGVRIPNTKIESEFFTPFEDPIAIEDPEGCVIVDVVSDPGHGPGLRVGTELFIIVVDDFDSIRRKTNKVYGVDLDFSTLENRYKVIWCSLVFDGIREVEGGSVWGFEGGSEVKVWVGDKKGGYHISAHDPMVSPSVRKNLVSAVTEDLLSATMVALRQVVLVNHPTHWLVERISGKRRDRGGKPSKKRKIPRSEERTRYLLITDDERKKYFSPSAVEAEKHRASPIPHPRRAHFRRIGYDEEGKPLYTWVRATWVGPREAEIRGVKYRVSLDF